MKFPKTLSALLFFCIISMGLGSCIGDKVMVVSYQVHNLSDDTLYLANTVDASSDYTAVHPMEKKTVHHDSKVCWMGDCRVHIKTDVLLDTLGVFQDSLQLKTVQYSREQWKLKKDRAILRIK